MKYILTLAVLLFSAASNAQNCYIQRSSMELQPMVNAGSQWIITGVAITKSYTEDYLLTGEALNEFVRDKQATINRLDSLEIDGLNNLTGYQMDADGRIISEMDYELGKMQIEFTATMGAQMTYSWRHSNDKPGTIRQKLVGKADELKILDVTALDKDGKFSTARIGIVCGSQR